MEFLVNLHNVEDIKLFVENAELYNVDIVACNQGSDFEVNGSSIMGLFSLDLSKPVVLYIDDEEKANIFASKIGKFIVR